MNTDEFLLEVERETGEPSYQGRFTSDDVLAMANQHQRITVVPAICSLNEDYFVVREVFQAPALNPYMAIPSRAPGRSIRKIEISEDGKNWSALPRTELDYIGWSYNASATGTPSSHAFINDQVQLLPTPSKAMSVAIYYELRPSNLTALKNCATITTTSTVSLVTQVQFTKTPVTLAVGISVDATDGTPGYRCLGRDLMIASSVGSNTFLLSGLVTGIGTGDVISPAGTTGIVQLPDEATDVLVMATGMQMLLSLAQPDMAKVLKDKMDLAIKAMNTVFTPRNQNSLPKVMPSALLGNRRGRRVTLLGGY